MARKINGPRMGTARPRDGVYQYPALDDSGAVVDLTEWANESIEICWIPDDDEYSVPGPLLYGFFATTEDAEAFDPTTPSDGGPVAAAPARLTGARGFVHITVPRAQPFLRLEAATGTGLCTVHHVEGT